MAQDRLMTLQKAKILTQILKGQSIEHYFHELSASQMLELRNFLEREVMDLSSRTGQETLDITAIKGKYKPAAEYYRQQDCNEPLESCLDETCYTANPVCFGQKMTGHLTVLVNLIEHYLKPANE